jgi:hypothetical protein
MRPPSPHRALALRLGLTRIAVAVVGSALLWWAHPHLARAAPPAPKVLFVGGSLIAFALLGGPYRRWVERTAARLEATRESEPPVG